MTQETHNDRNPHGLSDGQLAALYQARVTAIWVALVVPIVVALAAAVVLILWLPETPNPVATHWSDGGAPDGFSSPVTNIIFTSGFSAGIAILVGGIATFTSKKSTVTVWSGMNRLMASTSLALAVSIALMGVLLTHMQLGVADARDAGGVGGPLALAFGIGIVLGIVSFVIQPKLSISNGRGVSTEVLPLSPTERAVWLGTVRPSLVMAIVMGFSVVTLVLCMAAAWSSKADAVTLWVLGAATLLVIVVSAVSMWFRVRIDARGLEARAVVGWPVFRVPASDVDHVAAGQISPLADFGGWGMRWAPGRFGLVMRTGDGLVITRTDGRIFGITVDDAQTAASLLNSYSQAQQKS